MKAIARNTNRRLSARYSSAFQNAAFARRQAKMAKIPRMSEASNITFIVALGVTKGNAR